MTIMSDYEKVVKVIKSCKTNAQNQIAYRMCMNWGSMYKDYQKLEDLLTLCDESLIDIVRGH